MPVEGFEGPVVGMPQFILCSVRHNLGQECFDRLGVHGKLRVFSGKTVKVALVPLDGPGTAVEGLPVLEERLDCCQGVHGVSVLLHMIDSLVELGGRIISHLLPIRRT